MTTLIRNQANTLSVEWREYAGGPLAAVTDVQISAVPLAGGAAVLGPTATGVLTPATGVNVYSWTPGSGLALVDYLITWTGLDSDLETVSATEIVTLGVGSGLGGPYATLAALKARMGIPDSNTARDAELYQRLVSSATDINLWCHRQFGRSDVTTTRKFQVGKSGVDTHDFWTDDDLVVVPYVNGVAGTPWDMSTMDLEPLDGIVNEVPGHPFRRIAFAYGDHPLLANLFYRGTRAWITAKWGWENIPENVVTSNLMLAVADDKAKDAPFGVAGFGDYAVRIRQNPMVEEKLRDYVIDPIKVAS